MVASQAALGFHPTNMAVTPGKARGSQVSDNGFLPIPAHTSAGGNTGITCYVFTP